MVAIHHVLDSGADKELHSSVTAYICGLLLVNTYSCYAEQHGLLFKGNEECGGIFDEDTVEELKRSRIDGSQEEEKHRE